MEIAVSGYVGVLGHTTDGETMEADAITARECLMATIANQIRERGYYVADLAPNPPQALVDLRWAAQMAGRLIGCRTETFASAVGKRLPMKITVVVAPVESSRRGPRLDAQVRRIVEDLLQTRVSEGAARKSA